MIWCMIVMLLLVRLERERPFALCLLLQRPQFGVVGLRQNESFSGYLPLPLTVRLIKFHVIMVHLNDSVNVHFKPRIC